MTWFWISCFLNFSHKWLDYIAYQANNTKVAQHIYFSSFKFAHYLYFFFPKNKRDFVNQINFFINNFSFIWLFVFIPFYWLHLNNIILEHNLYDVHLCGTATLIRDLSIMLFFNYSFHISRNMTFFEGQFLFPYLSPTSNTLVPKIFTLSLFTYHFKHRITHVIRS